MSDPSTPPTVTIAGLETTLVDPPSLFALSAGRSEAQRDAGGIAEDLAFGAAALRMCWPEKISWPARVRPRPWRPGLRVGEYGAEVWEDLRAATKATTPLHDLQTACYQALSHALRSALTEEEVKAAEGFSEGQGEE